MRRTETAGAASADTTGGGTIATHTLEAGSRIPGTRVATEGTAVTTVTTSPIRSATTTRITITRRFRPEDTTEHMGGTTVRLGTIAEVTADLVEPNGTITEVDTGVSTEVKTGSVDAEGGTNSASIDGAPVTTAAPSTLTNAAGDPETAETMGDTPRTTTVSITAVPTGDVRSTTWAMTTYRSLAARRISFRPRVPAAVSPAG
jgi:hypothetical protein